MRLGTSFWMSAASSADLMSRIVAQRTYHGYVNFPAGHSISSISRKVLVSRNGDTEQIRGRWGGSILTVLPVKHEVLQEQRPRARFEIEMSIPINVSFDMGIFDCQHSASKRETSSQDKNGNYSVPQHKTSQNKVERALQCELSRFTVCLREEVW